MSRRPKNIIKRGETYYFEKRVRGRRIRRALSKNLGEARRKAQVLLERYSRTDPTGSSLETVKEFGERWLEEYIRGHRNPKGQELARWRFKRYMLPECGRTEIGALTRSHLYRIANLAKDRRCAPQTIRHILSDVRCMLKYAEEIGAVKRSPFVASVMPKAPEAVPRPLNAATVSLLLEVADESYPDRAFAVRLALLTGLRWGELHTLQWHDVKLQGSDPHLIVERTKSGRVRRVPLGPEAAGLLQVERKRTSSVFVLPFRGKNAGTFVRRIGRRAGQKLHGKKNAPPVRWTFHRLRHTFACRWLDQGGSIEVLQRILGHSTVRMTERYGKLSDSAVFAESNRIRLEVGHMTAHTDQERAAER